MISAERERFARQQREERARAEARKRRLQGG
jgi:hypothetical protein